MSQLWDFTWFMLRLQRYKRRRVVLQIRTQPGWEAHVREFLLTNLEAEGRGRRGIAPHRYPGLVEIRRPAALVAVLAHFDPPQALLEAASLYARLCSEQVLGRRPDPELAQRQERALVRLLALFPNPPRPAASEAPVRKIPRSTPLPP